MSFSHNKDKTLNNGGKHMGYLFLFILLFVIPFYMQQRIVQADRAHTKELLDAEQSQIQKSDSP